MFRYSVRRVRRNVFWLVLLALVWLLCSGEAEAGALSDRLASYPDWTDKPPTQPANGDLVYPDWMAGTWEMTSTLVDSSAPLAPEVETPGFQSNQSLLNEPITCEVRFEPRMTSYTQSFLLQPRLAQEEIVADRAFNGMSLAKAYMGDTAVKKVVIDSKNPNRQLTILENYHMLESTVTGRATEAPAETEFLTTELFQQMFRGGGRPYFNEVETTTAYHQVDDTHVTANQITAVYLSPQDPDYFKASNQPVALYRYELDLTAIDTPI